ncbi:MAG: c-type cytochrome, partial [Cyclobacteriaceae bacterium]|nr:c-type cytochrome [Cyclobacteriaceae bacterium]
LGRQLYRSNCSNCHGFENPKNPGTPNLTTLRNSTADSSNAYIATVLLNGKGQMPKFASLSEDERNALVAYIKDEGNDIILDSENLSRSNTIPWVATGHREMKDPEGFPINKRPWGTLNAIDLDKGEIAWQATLGTYPELEARGLEPTGTFNMGGPLVTAGGLVFIAATMDERFRAFDKDTGDVLWEYQMGAGGYATPATYEIDGKQYVVIAAGGGGKPGTKPGDAYYCFGLR